MNQPIKALPIEPKRPDYDAESVRFGACEHCAKRDNIRPLDGAMVCGNCSDAAYLAEWIDYAQSLRKIIDTTPSAPAVDAGARDEREAFEAWLSQPKNWHDVRNPLSPGKHIAAWMAWQARAALSASTEAAAGEPIWPVPLTLDHSHVFAHCIELQFEDEEDADQFFSMYSAAMGNAAVTGEPVTLTHEELRFVELVRDNPGRKLNGGEAFGESGDALWKRLESLGLIECVGGYKWRLRIFTPPAASGQKLTDEQREAIEWAAGRAHVEALGKPIDGVEGHRWRVLSNLFRASSATASDKEGA